MFLCPNLVKHQCIISIQGRANPHQMQVSIIFSKYLYHHWKASPVDSNCSKLLAYINDSYYVQNNVSTETSPTLIGKHVSLDMEFLKDLGEVEIQFGQSSSCRGIVFLVFVIFNCWKKEMVFVPRSPKIKSDNKAACFISYML